MRNWTYVKALNVSMVMLVCAHSLDIVMYQRLNSPSAVKSLASDIASDNPNSNALKDTYDLLSAFT